MPFVRVGNENASDGARPAKGQSAGGESRDTTSADDQLVCDALRLALVATRLRVAWHAGAIGAEKAMEVLDQSIWEICRPRTEEPLYNFYDRGTHGGVGGFGYSPGVGGPPGTRRS